MQARLYLHDDPVRSRPVRPRRHDDVKPGKYVEGDNVNNLVLENMKAEH